MIERRTKPKNCHRPSKLRFLPWKSTKDLEADRRLNEMQILEEHIRRKTRKRKKIKYVLSSGDQIKQHVEAIEGDFKRLQELVENAWGSQHDGIDFKNLTYPEKKTKSLTQTRSFVLKAAKQDVVQYQALYSCCSRSARALKLELSLFENATDPLKCKRLQFFMPVS